MRNQTIARNSWMTLGAAALGVLGCSAESDANLQEATATIQSSLSQTEEIRIGPALTVPAGDGVAYVAHGGSEFFVFGTRELGRISADGTNLDPGGILHPAAPSSVLLPGVFRAVARDGAFALALSTADGISSSRVIVPSRIAISRWTDRGSFVDAVDIRAGSPVAVKAGDLACGAGHCLAAFSYEFGGELVLFRNEGGTVTPIQLLSLPEQYLDSLTVRFNGTHYLVTYGAVQREVNRVTWSSKRVMVDPPSGLAPSPIATVQHGIGSAGMAASGTGHLFVYPGATWNGNAVFGRLLDQQGTPQGEVLHLADVGSGSAFTAAASNGQGYLAMWKSCANRGPCTVHGASVDATGHIGPIRDYGNAQPASQAPPRLVWGGSHYLAVWDEPPLRELYARRLDVAGAVVDRQPVLREDIVPREDGPALAWNECSYFAAYYQSTSDSDGDVVGTFLDGYGNARQALPFVVTDAYSPVAEAHYHDLVRSDSGYLRVSDLYVAPRGGVQRVSFEGALLDEQPIALEPPLEPLSASYSLGHVTGLGAGWLLAVERMEAVDGFSDQTTRDILLQPISPAGVVGPMQPLITAPGGQHSPQLAWNGTSGFAVWTDDGDSTSLTATWGAVLSSAGTPDVPFQIGSVPVAIHSYARLSTDGVDYLVAWQEGPALSAQKFSAAGSADGPRIQLTNPGALNRVIYDGRTFLVFTEHIQVGEIVKFAMRRVSRAGALLDADPVWLSTPAIPFPEPSGFDVASDGLGRTLFSYARPDGRLAGRFLTASDASPFPSSCPPVGPAPPPSCSFGAPGAGTQRATALSVLLLAAASRVRRRRALREQAGARRAAQLLLIQSPD